MSEYISVSTPRPGKIQHARSAAAAVLILATSFLGIGLPEAHAAKSTRPSISVIPTVTSIVPNASGGYTVSGFATAIVKGGKTYTAPFTAPLAVTASTCDVLDLQLGPINLNLLGLVVETSPICLSITANPAGGLLGTLVCDIANLLNADPLAILTQQLLGNLMTLLNGVLPSLNNAVLVPSLGAAPIIQRTCSVLDLAVGPLHLELLGLIVDLDDCSNGPVTVTITAVTGQGNLLGNLLCQLVGGGQINLGATLQNIINQLLGLLNL